MHRTPEPPPGGGSRSFDKLAWRPTHGAYLALAKHAQEACALRRAQGRPDGHAGAPSWRGRGGAASTRLGAKRPAAALRRERLLFYACLCVRSQAGISLPHRRRTSW